MKSGIEAPPKRYRTGIKDKEPASAVTECAISARGSALDEPDPAGLKDGGNLYEFARSNRSLRSTTARLVAAETHFVKPTVLGELEARGLPYATEVEFEYIDKAGKITPGRFDVVTIDPRRKEFS